MSKPFFPRPYLYAFALLALLGSVFASPAAAQGGPPAPTNLTITQDQPSTALLSWGTAPLVDTYYIYVSINGGPYNLDTYTGGGGGAPTINFRVSLTMNATK